MKMCTRTHTFTPIPTIESVLLLRQATLLAGTTHTPCFYVSGSLQLFYPPLDASQTALQPRQVDLEGGCLVLISRQKTKD